MSKNSNKRKTARQLVKQKMVYGSVSKQNEISKQKSSERMKFNQINSDQKNNAQALKHMENRYRDSQYSDYIRTIYQVLPNIDDEIEAKNYIYYFWLADSYRELGHDNEAKKHFEILLNKFPNDPRAPDGLMKIYHAKMDWHQLQKLSQEFQQKHPDLWQGYFWLAESYRQLQDYDNARIQFAVLHEKFPNEYKALEGLIEIAEKQQDWSELLELSQEFQQKHPDLWQGYWWQGEAYRHLNDYERAKKQFYYLVDKFPKIIYGYRGLNNIAIDNDDWVSINQISKKAIQQHPNVSEFYYRYGLSLSKLKKFDLAIDYFTKLDERFPKESQSQIELAKISLSQNAVVEAIERLEKLRLRFAQDTEVLFLLVESYIQHNEVQHATDLLEKISQTDVNHGDVTKKKLLLGRIYEAKYGHDYYVRYLKSLTEQYPKNEDFAFQYAHLLSR